MDQQHLPRDNRRNKKRMTISKEIAERKQSIIQTFQNSNTVLKQESSPQLGIIGKRGSRKGSIESSLHSHNSSFLKTQRKKQDKVLEEYEEYQLNSSEYSEESILTIQCVNQHPQQTLGKFMEALDVQAINFNSDFDEIEKEQKKINPLIKYADIFVFDQEEPLENNVQLSKIIKRYEKYYERNPFKDPYYIQLVPLTGVQRLKYELQKYNDNRNFLNMRKFIVFVSLIIPILAKEMMKSTIYKLLMTILILFNVGLFIVVKTQKRTDTFEIEQTITILFIIEICTRILISGFFFTKKAFFRNMQDIYDFTLIFATTINLYYPHIFIIDISPLRLVTLLFYLGDIFEGLGVMLKALKQSVKFLIEALMIVGLFSLIFAIIGLFLFQGLFNYRCENINKDETDGWVYCNGSTCFSDEQVCSYTSETPNIVSSFNNIIYSYGQVLRTITMDGWTWVMYFTIRIFNPWVWIYYMLIILVGGFFGFNLVIAVLKTHYSEAAEESAQQQEKALIDKLLKENQEHPERELINVYDVAFLRYIGFFNAIQRYRESFSRKNVLTWNLESENYINKTMHEARNLSAKQKSNNSTKMIDQSVWVRVQNFTLKNVLLRKILKLKQSQLSLNVKKYSDDPLELEILQKLQQISFSSLQSQVNYQIDQHYTSQNDVLLKLILIDQAQLAEKKFNPEKLRKIKFRHEYPDWRNQVERIKKQTQKSKQIKDVRFPIKIKPNKFFPKKEQTQNVKEQITSNNSIEMFERNVEKKYQCDQGSKMKIKKKQKQFSKIVDDNHLVYIQGYYLSYEELSDKINAKIKIIKTHESSNQFKYRKLREKELQNGKVIVSSNWSGKDIIKIEASTLERFSDIFLQLNQRDVIIWMNDLKGKFLNLKKYALIIIVSPTSRVFFDLIILINFTFLALWNIADSETIYEVENVSTIILSIELVLRLISLPAKEFTGNPNYIVQAIIVMINIIELTMKGVLQNIGDQNLRLIRGTKCILFYRCLKYNAMAVKIGNIASITFKQYIYLTFLIFLVIFMYSLIGMEMYAGAFDQTDLTGQLHSYDNIFKAFMTIFDIMTNDDWYGVFIYGSEVNQYFATIYSYSMVIILNYCTYGLFMAILLDGFGKYLNEPHDVPTFKVEQHAQITQDSNEELEQQVYQTILSPVVSQTNIILDSNQQGKDKVDLITNLLKSIKSVNKELLNKTPRLYTGIECNTSLYIFEKDNPIRILCMKLSTLDLYIYFMDLILYTSLITFMIKTYYDYEDTSDKTCDLIQLIINIQMFLDIIVNVIAKGLFLDKGSYFISMWQLLDLIYIISHFITFNSTNYAPIFDVFLYFGYLRPMKLLFRLSWLTQLRIALGYSLADITNVLITMLSVWIMFGVYGIILYEGQFGYCDDEMNFYINYDTCMAQNDSHWTNYKHNFDNITVAIPTLFVISTLDGWGPIYQIAQNGQIPSIGPQPFNSYVQTYFFFIIFVFIGSMFFLSFFTGVLYSNLKENQQKIEMTDVTQSQKEFQEISTIIIKDFPIYSSPPMSGIRKLASDVTNNSIIIKIMFMLLILDLIVLMCFYYGMTDEQFTVINNIHNALTIIYSVWVALLFLALGSGRFFDNYWRRFYFILIVISLIDFIADYTVDWTLRYYHSSPYDPLYIWLRLFFALRSLRVILTFQGLINLQRLMRVMVFALPSLGKIFTILIICMLIFALIGCQLYGTIDKGFVIDDQTNFKNVAQALLALFKCASGDDFRSLMTDTMQHNPYCLTDSKYCGSVNNQFFFFLFMFLSNYVLLNLFVLGLIEQFEQFFQLQNSLIQTYVENVDKIKTVWCKYSSETQGQAMNYKFLCKFLLDIGKPLGGGKDENLWDVAKLASSFKLKCDHYGYIQYNQLMYELFRRCFINEVFREGTESSIIKIKQYNKEMQLRLMYYRKNRLLERTHISPGLLLKANFNILHDYLTVLILYKTWESYSKLVYKKIDLDKSFSENEDITQYIDKVSQQKYNNLQMIDDDDDVSQQDDEQIDKQTSNMKESKQYSQQQLFNNSLNQNLMQYSSSIKNSPSSQVIGSLKNSKKVISFKNPKKKSPFRVKPELPVQESPKSRELKHMPSQNSDKNILHEELPIYKSQFDLSLQNEYKEGTLLSSRRKY